LTEELLEQVTRPGQYLGNEWGARHKSFDKAETRLAIAFPDLYELGMSNFGLKILYQIVNNIDCFICDRSYAPASDLEDLLRQRALPLWGWESRRPLKDFELVGFSLQYELTYTNVLNMLDLAQIPVLAADRTALFPLIFGGGPSSVNPEPMANVMDFFIIGDGEAAVPAVMEIVRRFKREHEGDEPSPALRKRLLAELACRVPGVYVPSLYEHDGQNPVGKPVEISHLVDDQSLQLPPRVLRQVMPLNDDNQPTKNLVSYLSLVHDREVLEVRRGCDRGCRFCQPGYTFLPVRERKTEDLLRLSVEQLQNSGHQEYSMLSLCVSDYTSLHDSVRALNEEHTARRSSLSFPSQRADRMNLDLAEELKVVRKSGITLAPEAGSERLRAVINKGLSHQQIISAIEAAYQSGWSSIKLYFMCGLPTERDEDLVGIVEILKEATTHCRVIRKSDPLKYKRDIEFTCTISNFVPKPFTPFQWFGQVDPRETARRHQVLRQALKEARLKNVTLNVTEPQISLLESVISRGDRRVAELIFKAWQDGCKFDAWDERFQPEKWHRIANEMGTPLEELACTEREVGSDQPWDVVHIGLNNWWMVKEWEKAMAQLETAPCSENLCHACGVCTELDTNHELAVPKPEVMKRNPFVKELSANTKDQDSHPSLFFVKPKEAPSNDVETRIRFTFTKTGDLRFISHLDMQHLLARAARRASLNLAYTQGFNPSPRLNLAQPLPLFQESLAEIGEVDLAQKIDAEEFKIRMNEQLPPEIQIQNCRVLPDKSNASLASNLGSAVYLAYPTGVMNLAGEQKQELLMRLQGAVSDIVQAINKEEKIEIMPVSTDPKKQSAPKDIKPGIISLTVKESKSAPFELVFELAHGSKMHVKPTELLSLLQPKDIDHPLVWRINRHELKAHDGSALFTL